MTCVATAQGLGTGCDTLFSQVRKLPCYSPLVVPVVRGEVGRGSCHLFFVFSFLSSFFSHCVLCQQSPTPSIFCCCSPFSSHFFQISLNAVLPSHSRSSSLSFSLHFLGICSLCQFFISHSFPIVRPISSYTSPVSLK